MSPINVPCKQQGHANKLLTFVCANPKCSKNRVLCSRCLTQDHKDCWNYTLEIEDIYKRSFAENANWVRNEDIKQALATIGKYGLEDSKDVLLDAFGEFIDREFAKVTEYFNQRVKEIKAKIISNLQEYSTFDSINVEDFMATLKGIYNFDSFIDILEKLNQAETTMADMNEELSTFFDKSTASKADQQDLEDMGNAIYTFTKDYLEINTDIFDKFKTQIPFDLFNGFPLSMKAWTWDSNNKSSKIELSENNTVARKIDQTYGYTTALGAIEISEGRFQWELEVFIENSDRQWIAFGVIEKELAKNLEDFPYKKAIGVCTYGHLYNMECVEKFAEFDKKLLNCDLDMHKGTFSVAYEGSVIARHSGNLTGKIFVPFVTLYRGDNNVRLVILQME